MDAGELKSVLEKETAIRRSTGYTGGDDEAEAELVSDAMGAKGLAAAVDSLPALIKQKKVLEIHTNIMQVSVHLNLYVLPGFSTSTWACFL